ncbi:hypothetical protein ROZALSC1DRAFT_26681, partial [Rozella allomycis CSF55]
MWLGSMEICAVCSSENLGEDPAQGLRVCIDCGTVIEESGIAASAAEHYAWADSGAQYIDDSIESMHYVTGKRKILKSTKLPDFVNNILAKYSLTNYKSEIYRIISKAKEDATSRGTSRSSFKLYTIASVYWLMRKHQKPITLNELANMSMANVYKLGKTCQMIKEYFNVETEVDPIIYLSRICQNSALKFKELSSFDIEKRAVQILESVKMAWLNTGRKPSAIAVAATWLAVESLRKTKFPRNSIHKICHELSIGLSSVSDRKQEMIMFFIKQARNLPWGNEIDKYLDEILSSKNLIAIASLDEEFEDPDELPPSFQKIEARAERRSQILSSNSKKINIEDCETDEDYVLFLYQHDFPKQDLLRLSSSEVRRKIHSFVNPKEENEEAELDSYIRSAKEVGELENFIKLNNN